MDERSEHSSTGIVDAENGFGSGKRLGEERAREILARAAALDAERNSEIELDQLREAAAAAGISPVAFEQALQETSHPTATDGQVDRTPIRAPHTAQVAHYADLIRDLLGDDVQVVVVENRIEGRDRDGLAVSINPAGSATAAVVAGGSLQRRLLALTAPALLPALFGLLLAFEEEVGIGVLLGVFLAVIASIVGVVVSHRREKKELEKRADRVRRQLQRMLAPGSERA